MTALIIIEAVVIGLLVLVVLGLLRAHGEILRTLRDLGVDLENEAPPIPARPIPMSTRTRPDGEATDLRGMTPDGNERLVGVVGAPHTTLLAFLSSSCATCEGFWQALNEERELRLPGQNTRLVIITKGPEAESPAAIRQKAPRQYTTVMSSDGWEAYGVPVTPYFVLVDGPSGRIAGEGAAATWGQLEKLLAQAAADAGILGSGRHSRRARNTEGRLDAVDDVLAASGITPGHPSLYVEPPPVTNEEPT